MPLQRREVSTEGDRSDAENSLRLLGFWLESVAGMQ
jgi:hypothetical protein